MAEGQHKLYLACDDIEPTVEGLERTGGFEYGDSIAERGDGLVLRFKVRGGGEVGLVQAGRTA